MIKKTISYTDFNGDGRTETFYFNLSKPEIIDLEDTMDGFSNTLRSIAEEPDISGVNKVIKTLILYSYGEKSADGKRLIKGENHQLAREFMETEAYSELYMSMVNDGQVFTDFVEGILPRDVLDEAKKQVAAESLPKVEG